jgi:(p)ppGpp synthase/HD superfamily hydrolase
MSTPALYSPLIVRALELAAIWHVGQVRKNPMKQIPYIAHPAAVGFLLQKAGCDDETIAAGILHDVVEDCGIPLEQVATETTPRVADLVRAVTEEPKEMDWEQRKAAYRDVLSRAPLEALAIAAADHISNNWSIVEMAASHPDVWSIFYASKQQRVNHEAEVLAIIEERLSGPLVEALHECVDLIRNVPG